MLWQTCAGSQQTTAGVPPELSIAAACPAAQHWPAVMPLKVKVAQVVPLGQVVGVNVRPVKTGQASAAAQIKPEPVKYGTSSVGQQTSSVVPETVVGWQLSQQMNEGVVPPEVEKLAGSRQAD